MPHSCPRSRERSLIQWSSPSKVPQTCPTLLCRMRSSMTSKSILAFGSIFPFLIPFYSFRKKAQYFPLLLPFYSSRKKARYFPLLLISERVSIFPPLPSIPIISEKSWIFLSHPPSSLLFILEKASIFPLPSSPHDLRKRLTISSSSFPFLHLRKRLNIPPLPSLLFIL